MESGGEEEATATPAAGASPATGRLKGSPELSLDADMRDVVKTAGRSVSSWKAVNGVAAFCDDNLDTDWSRGAVSLVEHPVLEGPCAGAELKLDESYTRSKMSVGAGDDFHNLKVLIFATRSHFKNVKKLVASLSVSDHIYDVTGVFDVLKEVNEEGSSGRHHKD